MKTTKKTRFIIATILVLLVMSLSTPVLASAKSTSRHQRLKASTAAVMDEWVDYAEGHGWKVYSKKVVKCGRHDSVIKIRMRRSGPSRKVTIKIKVHQPKRGAAKVRLYAKPFPRRHHYNRITNEVLWAWLR
jgi:uncharacterized surface anchored protein